LGDVILNGTIVRYNELEGHAASTILMMEEANIYLANYMVSHSKKNVILIFIAVRIKIVGL
jgi:hypothetical protein